MSTRQQKRIQKQTPHIDRETKLFEKVVFAGISFHWDSKLTDAEKDEIKAWAKGLSPRQAAMLGLIMQDVRDQTDFDCADYMASQDPSY